MVSEQYVQSRRRRWAGVDCRLGRVEGRGPADGAELHPADHDTGFLTQVRAASIWSGGALWHPGFTSGSEACSVRPRGESQFSAGRAGHLLPLW